MFVLLVFSTRPHLAHPIPGTNTPLAPSSWPSIAPVVRGNTNRNRCCLPDLPYDPNDIWTHFSRGPARGRVGHFVCSSPLMFGLFCLCASGFISDIKILPSPCWGKKTNCHQRRDAARFCSRPNCRDGRCVYVCAWVRVMCFHSYSVQINSTELPNDLIPDPLHKSFCGIFDNSFQLSVLIIILITEHTHTHIHINPALLSLPSGTLLLCLGEWPYRSH